MENFIEKMVPLGFHKNENIEYKNYYLNGFYYTRQDYLEKIKELKSCKKMS
jgi:hypothetical protein